MTPVSRLVFTVLLVITATACKPESQPAAVQDTGGMAESAESGSPADSIADAGENDADDDGVPNRIDNCPVQPNADQADIDGNGQGDVCDDGTIDLDRDGAFDRFADNCPGTRNPEQADNDGDGIGNACDHDTPAADPDGDGVPNRNDNCPSHVNPEQQDSDNDGTGDVCEDPAEKDADGDGVFDDTDNCVYVANPDQANRDGDETGDACDLEQGRDCDPESEVHACGRYTVDIVYAIPSNRAMQANAVATLRDYLVTLQDFFREQMELQGYGPKTFRIETEVDSVTPKVAAVHLSKTDTGWGNLYSDIENAPDGYPLFDPGHVALVVVETHIQYADGHLYAFTLGGASKYANMHEDNGASTMTGDFLARLGTAQLTDDLDYHGRTDARIGPYPLQYGVTFVPEAGRTMSEISSTAYGTGAQLLGKAFGLRPDFRNEDADHGNLMGNGYRNFRGNLRADSYSGENVRLSAASALLLNFNPFFNPDAARDDKVSPSIYFLSEGTLTPRNGLCEITFLARDEESGLGGAVLRKDGNVVAQMKLDGREAEATFRIHDYTTGVEERYDIIATDRQGNRNLAIRRDFVCAAGYNRAPYPHVTLGAVNVTAGEPVEFDAGKSVDPDGSDVSVEWDVDNDGVFDTPPSTDGTYAHVYDAPGTYQVVARITDTDGASSLSVPLGIRVTDQ